MSGWSVRADSLWAESMRTKGQQTWTIGGDDGIDVLCFNRVDDIVTATRDVVAVLENCYVLLLKASARCCVLQRLYKV